tara:strand:+ start:299 stop:787 length:489 start_codon:yes stop_codon:yes gene_type:complete
MKSIIIIAIIIQLKAIAYGDGGGNTEGNSGNESKVNDSTNSNTDAFIEDVISDNTHVVRTENYWFTTCVFYTENNADSFQETNDGYKPSNFSVRGTTNSSKEYNDPTLINNDHLKKYCEPYYLSITIVPLGVILTIVLIFGIQLRYGSNKDKPPNSDYLYMI